MDTKTLIADAKARFSFNASKTYLSDKYNSKLIFANQNGLWKATPELLVFLAGCGDSSLVLLDSYNNPIKVDPMVLLERAREVYTKVMEAWYVEFEELKNTR